MPINNPNAGTVAAGKDSPSILMKAALGVLSNTTKTFSLNVVNTPLIFAVIKFTGAAPVTVTANVHKEVPATGVKVKAPGAVGVPLPTKTILFGPVAAKTPVAEKVIPLTAVVVME